MVPFNVKELNDINILPEPVPVSMYIITNDSRQQAINLASNYRSYTTISDNGIIVSCKEFPGIRAWGITKEVAEKKWNQNMIEAISTLLAADAELPST